MFWDAVGSYCQASLANFWVFPATPRGLQVVETVRAYLGSWHGCHVCSHEHGTAREYILLGDLIPQENI